MQPYQIPLYRNRSTIRPRCPATDVPDTEDTKERGQKRFLALLKDDVAPATNGGHESKNGKAGENALCPYWIIRGRSAVILRLDEKRVAQNTHMNKEKRDTVEFLKSLYGGVSGFLILWTKSDKRTISFKMPDQLEDAATAALPLAVHDDVYFGVGLQSDQPTTGRGTSAGVCVLPGLWLDLDVAGDAHKAVDLPPTIEDALQLLEGLPTPSIVVLTGGGLHLYWLRTTPAFGTKVRACADLCKRLQKVVQGRAKAKGWRVDSTYDPARVLRLPGTLNRKFAEPFTVTAEQSGQRYSLVELEAAVKKAEANVVDDVPSIVFGGVDDAPATGDGPAGVADAATPAGSAVKPTASSINETDMARPYFEIGGISYSLGERIQRYRGMLFSERFKKSISGKNGHDRMFHAACMRYAFAVPKDDARRVLEEYNREKCVPPWSAEELEHKLKDSRCSDKKPAGYLLPEEPKKPEKTPEFPMMALPPWARRVCTRIADAAQVSPDAVAVIMLSAVSGLLARQGWCFEWKKGKKESPNIYALVSMRPSEHKTTFVQDLAPAIWDAERRLQERHAVESRELREDLARKKSSLEAEKRKKNPDHGRIAELSMEVEDTQLPPEPNLLAEDATPEALEELLAGNPCVMFLSAEAQITDNMLARYSNEQSIKIYLKGWSGDSYKINRKGKKKVVLERPLLAVGVACQPDALKMMAQKVEGARGLGLLSRILACIPPSLVGTRTPDSPSIEDGVLADWERCVQLALEAPPKVLTQTREAKDVFNAWYRSIEMGLKKELRAIEDWAGKAQAGQVARIATVLHFLWGVQTDEMPRPVMERAVAVTAYFLQHAFAALGQYEPDAIEEMAGKIAEWASSQKEPWKLRTLRANLRCTRPKDSENADELKERVLDALEMLVERGCIKEANEAFQWTGQPWGVDGLLADVVKLLAVPKNLQDEDFQEVKLERDSSCWHVVTFTPLSSPSLPSILDGSDLSYTPCAANLPTNTENTDVTVEFHNGCAGTNTANKLTTDCQRVDGDPFLDQPLELPKVAKVVDSEEELF